MRTTKGYEVDFHARFPDGPNGTEELIQVCADTGSGETIEREMRAMKDAAVDFPRAQQRFLMLTLDQISSMTVKGIVSQPVYEWLLN